jgi:flagellar hook-associated protein 1 FlgK
MLTNISAVLGNDIRSSNVMLNTYESASVELDTSRESVAGVDLNDEAMNMIQYQKAYSAACRLMTVLDEALDKLINGTGVAGL